MLMAARRSLKEPDFEKLLHCIVVLTFRYNVIGMQNPSEQERIYNETAFKLYNGEISGLREILNRLRPVYPGDKQFKAAFAVKSFNNTQNRIVRYILAMLEKQQSGTAIEEDGYTLEHILPQKPNEGWENFTDMDLETCVDRIGNMALLEKEINKDAGSLPYSKKRSRLIKSAVPLTRQMAEKYEEWTPEKIAARQRELARIATTVWRIDQLS